ncbi:Cyanovirin-N [Naviculisporaceae sp. PSN 640]
MQLTSALQSFVAMAVMIPAVIANPVALDNSAVEERSIAKRSYILTCSGCSIGGGISGNRYLSCDCNKPGGGTNPSTLDLDKCIVNDKGVAKWRANGGFSATCGNAGLSGGRYYNVYCYKPDGSQQFTWFDLDEKIHNINGNLQCHV